MKILFDTNVVLDLLLDREPHSSKAAQLFAGVELGSLSGLLCATTVTTIHYLSVRVLGPPQARSEVRKLLRLFEVAPVTRAVLEEALDSPLRDFEDAVLTEAVRQTGAEGIVTRSVKDFHRSPLPVYAPDELLAALGDRGR